MGKIYWPEFQGRIRECARIVPLIRTMANGRLDRIFPGWLEFILKNYGIATPYHGVMHVLYGLVRLLLCQEKVPSDVLDHALIAWIGHDAGHTGISSQSPESGSAETLVRRFGNTYTPTIMATVFPYQSKSTTPEMRLIRYADTLGPYLGIASAGLTTKPRERLSYDAYLFESLYLWRELRKADELSGKPEVQWTTLAKWFLNGQARFFPDQLEIGVRNDDFFYEGFYATLEDVQQEVFGRREFVESICDSPKAVAKLVLLEHFGLRDVTLLEFADYAQQLRF